MRQFYAVTEDLIKSAHTTLPAELVIGSTEITVPNVAQFRANKYILLSEEGTERAELHLITEISTTLNKITIAAPGTKFTHYEDEPLVQFDYNQRRFYKWSALSEDWSHVAVESPRDIAVDCPLGTLFEDADGTPEDKYCATYYNAFTEVGTEPDDAKSVLGTETANLCSIMQVRVAAGWRDNYNIPDSVIDEARQDAQGEVWAALREKYTFPITRKSSFLRRIVVDMAVGILFTNEYGKEVQNIAVDGYAKQEDARKRLDKLASGLYTLYDEIEEEDQASSDRGSVKFYPDDSTEDEDDERIFSIGDKF